MQEQQLNKRHQRRAVAPIIATLLMIAVTVVGGILIFVFAQDFFSDTSVITPTFDQLEFFGYDARDLLAATADRETANGGSKGCAGDAIDGEIADDDCIFIYIRNLGDKAAIISEVRVFGERYTFSTTEIVAGSPPVGTFVVGAADGSDTDSAFIDPNNEATIAISYEAAVTDPIKVGTVIPITIVTGSDTTVLFNIISGAQRGGS